MSANEKIRTDDEATELSFEELEQRVTPLVVISIIGILVGLLLPAVN